MSTEYRVKYLNDLIADCRQAMAEHSDETAFEHPQDRARVMAAMIVADGLNGVRKTLTGRS
jgi:hypothetical protein